MGNREKGTELPISVVDTVIEESKDMQMFGAGMTQLMQDIENAIVAGGLIIGGNFSELEKIIEDIMHEKGAFIVSLEQAGTDKEGTMYLKHMNDGNPIYFAVGKRTLDAGGKTVYMYDSVFKANFVNKLHALIIQKKAELNLVDTDSAADLGVLQEELLNPDTIDGFVKTKLEEARGILSEVVNESLVVNLPAVVAALNKGVTLLNQITYAVDVLCSHPAYADQCTSYKEELAGLYGIKDEIEKRKALYAKQNSPAGDPGRFTRTLDVTSAPVDQLKVLIATDFSAIEKELARTDIDIATKRIGIQPMLARVHGYILQLQSYPDQKSVYESYLVKYRLYGKQLQELTQQVKIDYDRDVSYYVGDNLHSNPAFRAELATLDNQFPNLSVEQKRQVAMASNYLTTDPEMFMTTMAAIYGNEHHSAYLEKYFALVQQYNDGEISKIRADILALKAERTFNREDLGTVREARVDAREAGLTFRENKKREKYVRQMLRCVLQAEASERRTKMMLDIAARVKSGDVGSNALPLPNMNFGEVSYYPQTPGNSVLRTTLSGMGYASLDQIPKELFDGIDMTLFPELTTVPYTMNLEGYLNPDISKEARGEIGDDSRINRNMESFGDAELMDRFALIVNSKDKYEKDKYPDGWMPVFQEVAKRYLTQDLNVLAFMQTYGWEESKQKELLETCLFTLVDDTVIDEMRIRRFGYGAITKDDEILKEHIIGHIFVKSVMKHHGVDPSREERMKSKLAEAFGGGWNNNEGYEGNDKVGRIINEHIASLPKQPYGGTDRGGSKWLDKSLEAKDFLYTADGSWGGVNRALNMGIIGGLTSLGISPENAAGVAGAVKLVGGGLLAFMAIKGWYNNFWKGQSFTNKLWKNALLFGGLYALPRALTNKSLGELWNYGMHGDRNKTGLIPGPLLQRFGMDAKMKTNPDEFQTEFETGIAFGPMTLGAMGKYLRHKDGKFKLEGQDLKNFFHAPESEVPRQSKEQIARLLATCKNNERRLSDYLTQGLIRSGFAADGSNFVKFTTTDPYQTKTFEELQRSHMEIIHLEEMFEGILGDEATKTELSTWYVGLSPEEKEKAAERIAEVKKFQTKRTETTPYVTFLLRRKELRPGPTGSVLETMDDTKADALAAGLNEYTTKKGAHAKQYIMDPTGVTTFDELFLGGCGTSTDIAKLIYADDGLQKLREYEKVAGTEDFMETFVADYTKDWRCGTRQRSGVDMNMHNLVLKNIPGIPGEIMLTNETDPSDATKTKLSIWLKNGTSGVWEEFHRKQIHDTQVHSPSLGMDTSPATSLGFYMKLGTGPGGVAPTMPDSFSDQFFPGIIAHLQKGATKFRVKEERLSAETASSAGTRPTWIRDKKNTGIWKIDPDIPAKLLGPQIEFTKTGKTMP